MVDESDYIHAHDADDFLGVSQYFFECLIDSGDIRVSPRRSNYVRLDDVRKWRKDREVCVWRPFSPQAPPVYLGYAIDSDGDYKFPSGAYLMKGHFRPEDIVGEVIPQFILVRHEGGWALGSGGDIDCSWTRKMIPDPDPETLDPEVTPAWDEFEECYEELIRVLKFGASEGHFFYRMARKAGYRGKPLFEAWMADRMGRMIAAWEGRQ
jgi:hypothetical protein